MSETGRARLAGRTVLVTGSSGFVGVELCRALRDAGAAVRGALRVPAPHPVPGVESVTIPDLLDRTAVQRAAAAADAIVHLAGRAHVLRERAADSVAEYRRVNVDGTRSVVEAACAAGVQSVIFASTVKVVGEATAVAWTEETPPQPQHPYGRSKLEAEAVVRKVAGHGTLCAAVLRLPLVYGPGVKGNMRRLFALVDRGVPLPFGGVDNRRSLLSVDNLTAAIRALLERPVAGAQVFFVSDGADLSLPDLITRIGVALSRPANLVPVPPSLLRLAGRAGDLLNRVIHWPLTSEEIDRLTDSLVVDSSRLTRVSGFRPPHTVDEGLRRTAEWFHRVAAGQA